MESVGWMVRALWLAAVHPNTTAGTCDAITTLQTVTSVLERPQLL